MRNLFWIWMLPLLLPTMLFADAPPLPAKASVPNAKTMQVGTSVLCDFDGITASGVGNPEVADIVPLSTRCLLINAKASGATTVFVLDKAGKHLLRVTVTQPETDLSPVATKIQTAIGLPDVTAQAVNETVFLEGTVETTIASERAEAIAGAYTTKVKNLLTVRAKTSGAYAGTLAETYANLLNETLAASGVTARIMDDTTIALTGKYVSRVAMMDSISSTSAAHTGRTRQAETDIGAKSEGQQTPAAASDDPLVQLLASLPPRLKVINLINFSTHAPRQIIVKAKIIDIDRNASKDLGIDWGSLHIVDSSASGRTYQFQSQPFLFGQSGDNGALNFNSLLGGGPLKRVLPFAAQINALITENKARILSEPSIMVLDGNEGSLLVGGEIPIPVSQGTTNGGGGNVTVEYKQFGIQLNILPNILADNKIQMTVMICRVSDGKWHWSLA